MKKILLLFVLSYCIFAEAGIIIPKGMTEPNQKILSVDKMRVDVKIEGLYARVKIMQIFKNHTSYNQEGEYIFIMPDEAMISNFAIWEDSKRIKGIMLEKKKARKLYEQIKLKMIDPGLLEKKSNSSFNKFSVNVAPILPNSYKRIEIEYTELLPINFLNMNYYLSLKPLVFKKYNSEIKHFELNFDFIGQVNIKNVKWIFPVDINLDSVNPDFSSVKNDGKNISFKFKKDNFLLREDFSLSLDFELNETNFKYFTYRNIDKIRVDYSPGNNGRAYKDKFGFFLGELFLKMKAKPKVTKTKKVVVVFDNSLSMKWLKLAQSVNIFKAILDSLGDKDDIDLIMSNKEALPIFKKFKKATSQNKSALLEKLLSLKIINGTNLEKLTNVLAKYPKNTHIYWISDGFSTLGEIKNSKLSKIMAKKLQKLNIFVLGVGNDNNKKLLSSIAKITKGYYLHFYENEDIRAKMELFKKAINQNYLNDFSYKLSDNFQDLYTIGNKENIYDESSFFLVGRYREPSDFDFKISYKNTDNKKEDYSFKVKLPKKEELYSFVRRIWAKLRIDYLLQEIYDKGENKDYISEIIALSKEYNILSPYTSFLAAPRSFVRPRSIIPGDPVLRVKTDKDIISVTAKFEFGLSKKLYYITEKDMWETRFLAPYNLKDGDYKVELYLKDKNNEVIVEQKEITIDSTPPIMNLKYIDNSDNIKIVVNASKDSKKIFALLKDSIIPVKYDKNEKSSIAYISKLKVKKGDIIKFILEDFAHNTSTIYSKVNF